MTEHPPAGWFPDPERPGQQRYWDGQAWTDARQPDFTAPPPPPTGYAPPGYGTQPGYGGPPGMPAGYGVAMGPAPNNYLVWAILATVLCCLPAGVVSLVKSSQVNTKWNQGDSAGAIEASRQAKQWAIISAVVGVVVTIGYLGIVLPSID